MASTTPNIGLTLPTGTDGWKRSVINGNFSILDTKIGAVGNTPLQTQINTLSSKITTLFKTKTYTATKSIPSGYGYITASEFDFATPTGYTPIGILDFSSSSNALSIRAVSSKATSGQGAMWFANGTSNAVSTDASITVLYALTNSVNA